jgi:hypothetical protein
MCRVEKWEEQAHARILADVLRRVKRKNCQIRARTKPRIWISSQRNSFETYVLKGQLQQPSKKLKKPGYILLRVRVTICTGVKSF